MDDFVKQKTFSSLNQQQNDMKIKIQQLNIKYDSKFNNK